MDAPAAVSSAKQGRPPARADEMARKGGAPETNSWLIGADGEIGTESRRFCASVIQQMERFCRWRVRNRLAFWGRLL